MFPTLRRSFPWGRRTSLAQRLSLLRLIAVGSELHLPLSPLLDAWADDERGIQADRVRRLAGLIAEGMPLPDAVEEVRGALRDEDVLAIRFGAQSGTLARSLRASLDDAAERLSADAHPFRDTLVYAAVVAALFLGISIFYFVKIVPAINVILSDYNVDRPAPLTWAIQMSQVAERYWWLWTLLIFGSIWYVRSARTGRFLGQPIWIRRLSKLRDLRSAEVLRKLSVAADAGRPIAGAISTLARYHFDPPTRHKLLFVRNEVEQGAEVWPSMASAGLLTAPDVTVLDAAERLGNRPWALKQLADGKERRADRWLKTLADLTMPVVVVVLGAFVLLQGLSLFVPLVHLLFTLL